jgi:nitrogen-specific signal transduction histidine kinase
MKKKSGRRLAGSGKKTRAKHEPSHEPLLSWAWKEALADFTPGLAHELNNTFTGVLGMSESCLAVLDAANPLREGLALIQTKSREASQLLHAIARLHQASAGRPDYQDLNSLTAEMVQVLRKLCPRHTDFAEKFAPGALPIQVDAPEFRRVFLALASSALKTASEPARILFQTSGHKALPSLKDFHGKGPSLPAACLSIAHSGPPAAIKKASVLRPKPAAEKLDGFALTFQYARHFAEQNGGGISLEPGAAGMSVGLWLPQAAFGTA